MYSGLALPLLLIGAVAVLGGAAVEGETYTEGCLQKTFTNGAWSSVLTQECTTMIGLQVKKRSTELGDDAGQLFDDLFGDESSYKSEVIPMPPAGGSLEVELGVSLVNLDLDRQIVSGTTWVRLRWNDYRLTWNPSDYGGVDILRVPYDEVWTPDIEVYNAADFGENSFHSWMSDNTFEIMVYNNGTVLVIPALPFKAICEEVDITLGEGEAQHCIITMGSWTHSGKDINLVPYNSYDTKELLDYIDMSEMRNSNWVVTSQKNDVRTTKKYPGHDEDYYSMKYDFQMQRAYIKVDGSMIENSLLPMPLADIYSKYKAGDNLIA